MHSQKKKRVVNEGKSASRCWKNASSWRKTNGLTSRWNQTEDSADCHATSLASSRRGDWQISRKKTTRGIRSCTGFASEERTAQHFRCKAPDREKSRAAVHVAMGEAIRFFATWASEATIRLDNRLNVSDQSHHNWRASQNRWRFQALSVIKGDGEADAMATHQLIIDRKPPRLRFAEMGHKVIPFRENGWKASNGGP